MEANSNHTIMNLLEFEFYLVILFILIGFGIFIYLLIRLKTFKSFKEKYDFILNKETKLIWYGFLAFLIGTTLEYQIFGSATGIKDLLLWYFAKFFTGVMFATIAGYFVYKLLQLYYPAYLNKRLKALRYKPRISPKSGKPMKLLSEEEEDVHLSEGMQAEEEVFSVDYDVWIDEETGYTQIEKYQGKLIAEKCPKCNFQSLRVVTEEVKESPSVEEGGILIKHYQCNYCNHHEKRSAIIAKLDKEQEEEPLPPLPQTSN